METDMGVARLEAGRSRANPTHRVVPQVTGKITGMWVMVCPLIQGNIVDWIDGVLCISGQRGGFTNVQSVEKAGIGQTALQGSRLSQVTYMLSSLMQSHAISARIAFPQVLCAKLCISTLICWS